MFAIFVPMQFGIMHLFLFSLRNQTVLSVAESAFAAGFCAGTLWLVGTIYQKIRHREGLGFGDVKMVAMIGAFLGLQGALLTLIVGSLLGAIVGLCYIWFTGKDASTYELPFGTFLGAAALARWDFSAKCILQAGTAALERTESRQDRPRRQCVSPLGIRCNIKTCVP